MIVCVWEKTIDLVQSRVFFIDTDLAVSEIQREYVDAVSKAMKDKGPQRVSKTCSLMFEDDDELMRLTVKLPQFIVAQVELVVGSEPERKKKTKRV